MDAQQGDSKGMRELSRKQRAQGLFKNIEKEVMIMSELSKDEILKRAQSENKGRDFAELEAGKNDASVAAAVALILGAVLCAVELIMGKGMNYALYLVVAVINASLYIRKAVRKPVKENVITAVMFGIAAALFLVAWVISLLDL